MSVYPPWAWEGQQPKEELQPRRIRPMLCVHQALRVEAWARDELSQTGRGEGKCPDASVGGPWPVLLGLVRGPGRTVRPTFAPPSPGLWILVRSSFLGLYQGDCPPHLPPQYLRMR